MAKKITLEVKKLIQRANEVLEMFEFTEGADKQTMVSWYTQAEQIRKANNLRRAISKFNQAKP